MYVVTRVYKWHIPNACVVCRILIIILLLSPRELNSKRGSITATVHHVLFCFFFFFLWTPYPNSTFFLKSFWLQRRCYICCRHCRHRRLLTLRTFLYREEKLCQIVFFITYALILITHFMSSVIIWTLYVISYLITNNTC